MPFDRMIEAIIKEAMERGEFDDLSGKGKPLDLTAYFDTPEEVRAAYAVLKNAGMPPREVQLLKEIAELKQIASAMADEKKRFDLRQEIREKQVEFGVIMERSHLRRH
ncbi:MAG TPA: DUF1992 domain-containing protein [Anaerolineales bacterium]|nr:DUF1992 domain-containing protein [Anaerolineales bacterium]